MNPVMMDYPNAINQSASKLMTVDELARISGVTENTVIKNRDRIKGYKQTLTDDYFFTPGTRYPFSLGFHKVETYADKLYVLLKALNNYKYISHEELRLEESQFNSMLNHCLSNGYIEPNHTNNPYGANGYDITNAGSEFYKKLKNAKRSEREALVDRLFKNAKSIKDLLQPFSFTSSNDGSTP